MDDYQFDKQFRNMGIDASAVKNTRVKGSSIEIIDVSGDQKETAAPETKPEEEKQMGSSISEDALSEVKSAAQRANEATNQRIENLKSEINNVLGQFHNRIEQLKEELKHVRAQSRGSQANEPAPQQQPAQPQQQSQQPAEQQQSAPNQQPQQEKKDEFGPGGKEVSVENIFDFSNARDFKRA